jgi:cell division protein FtsB
MNGRRSYGLILLALLCCGLLFYVVYGFFFRPYGLKHYYELSHRQHLLQKKLAKLEIESAHLAEKNRRLSHALDLNALEDSIRGQLGYVRPQEYVIVLPKTALSGKPSHH